MESVGTPALWAAFGGIVLVVLAIDLMVGRDRDELTFREAAVWSAIWISLALAFGGAVWHWTNPQSGLEYYTGYLIEKALSVDNLFVFIVIFKYFDIKGGNQRRVLLWGILGALVMRALFILVGAALLQRFHFLFFVFGAFLVYTGAKLLFSHGEEVDPSKTLALRMFRRAFPVTDEIVGHHFFVIRDGRRLATRLMVVVVVLEATDLVFAVDSIPAVLAVTTDPFIVYTSNIFAILGLRALYFLLVNAMTRLRYLNAGLAFVLAFIGVKMVLAYWMKIPIGISLAIVAGLIAVATVASLIGDRRDKK